MTWPICKIVREPAANSQEYIDLNQTPRSGDAWIEYLSQMDILGDPTFTDFPNGEILEGTRDITLPLRFDGPRGAALVQKAKLARILMRPRPGYFMFQPGPADPPTFFRLHRRAGGSIDMRYVDMNQNGEDFWEWDVTCTADAFGLGEKVTMVPVTVRDPKSGSAVVELEDVTGSVPAPAIIEVNPNGPLDGWTNLFNTAAAEPDSALQAGGIIRYGGDFNAVGGASSLVTRYSDDLPEAALSLPATSFASVAGARTEIGYLSFSPGEVPPGTYKVVLLVGRNGENGAATAQFRVGLRYGDLITWARKPTAFMTNSGYTTDTAWLDCGSLSLPTGVPLGNLSADEVVEPTISIGYTGVSGSLSTRTFAVARIMLIPVSTSGGAGPSRTMKVIWGYLAGPNNNFPGRVDGERRIVNTLDPFKRLTSAPTPQVIGGFPMLVPQARNLLTWLPRVRLESGDRAAGHFRVVDMYAQITVSYYPRWLHLASE